MVSVSTNSIKKLIFLNISVACMYTKQTQFDSTLWVVWCLKKRCMLGGLRGLHTALKQTRGTSAHSQRQISFTAEGKAQWHNTCICTVTKQVFQKRQQKARVADHEARGSKPIPSHCHGNTNQTLGGKLWQQEHKEWDENGNTEKGRWLKLPFQAKSNLNILLILL